MPVKTLILGQSPLSNSLAADLGWLGGKAILIKAKETAIAGEHASRIYCLDLDDLDAVMGVIRGEAPKVVMIADNWVLPEFYPIIRLLEESGVRVFPNLKVVRLASSVKDLGHALDRISIPRYLGFEASTFDALATATDVTGYPCVLKNNSGMKRLVNSRAELGHCWEQFYARGENLKIRVQPRRKVLSLLHSVVGFGLNQQYISDPIGLWTDLPSSTYNVSKEQAQLTKDYCSIWLDYLNVEGLFTLTFAVLDDGRVVFYDFVPHPNPLHSMRIADTNVDSLALYAQIISGQWPKVTPSDAENEAGGIDPGAFVNF